MCSSGSATLFSIQGTGAWRSVTIDGCTYGYFAQYECTIVPAPEATPAAPTPEPTPSSPTPAPTASQELTAYWDMGTCGPYGDDHNKDYCPGNQCPAQVSVSTSVCSSGTADLRSFQGTGGEGSTTIDNCKYGFFAQYECTDNRRFVQSSSYATPTPEPTTETATSCNLIAYWDVGNCGPCSDDHNKVWCPGDPANCPSLITVSTSICSSGLADLKTMLGTGSWASVTSDGCTYSFFAQYVCSKGPKVEAAIMELPPDPTPEPTAHTPETSSDLKPSGDLVAYWDMGHCGPYSDDHNREWCPGDPANCPSQLTVSTSICATGTADLASMLGSGSWGSVTVDGCQYGFFAQYKCSKMRRLPPPADAAATNFATPGTASTAYALAGILALSVAGLLAACVTSVRRWRKRAQGQPGVPDANEGPMSRSLAGSGSPEAVDMTETPVAETEA